MFLKINYRKKVPLVIATKKSDVVGASVRSLGVTDSNDFCGPKRKTLLAGIDLQINEMMIFQNNIVNEHDTMVEIHICFNINESRFI